MTQTSPSHRSDSQSKLPNWLYNLSIRNKQITALFSSELITIVSLVGVGAFLVVSSGRTQLSNQAKSELAVTEVNYNIKINQMGFGFRGQAENPVMINAVSLQAQGKPLNAKERDRIKQILQNEVKAREIEYATLVGQDFKIIANANQNRVGEVFNPNNLVSKVFQDAQQIKTSEIISWSELAKEAPNLPANVNNQDALIRYTVTPVKDPATGKVLGALISGDIINGKLPIVSNTIKSFSGGYSGIYWRSTDNQFNLAVSQNLAEGTNLESAQPGVTLPNQSLLQAAVLAKGKEVKGRLDMLGHSYTVAAKSINNSQGEPIAILVRGTLEDRLNSLLFNSLMIQLIIAGLVIGKDIFLATLLSKVIVEPIEKLKANAQAFFQGDRQVRTDVLGEDEIGQLTSTFNEMAGSIALNEQTLQREAKQSKLFADITSTRVLKQQDLDILFQKVLEETRQTMGIEQIVLYMLLPGESGYVAHESLSQGLPTILNQKIDNESIPPEVLAAYLEGNIFTIDDLSRTSWQPKHLKLMKNLPVKAFSIVPIKNQQELFGFLIANYHSQTHDWQEYEIGFFKQLTTQLELVLERISFLEGQKIAQEQEKSAKEQLQKRALELLMEVDPLSKGDLTIRATVTPDEVGTIADSYNSTIESLRKLVAQVQVAAKQVETTTNSNESSIQELSTETIKQTTEIETAIAKIKSMTESIDAVAQNAKQAEAAVAEANQTVVAGDEAMNRTVRGIMSIQETVTETAEKVKRLGESSQDISQAVHLIGRFAAQTHLLALKASIEAARAGEQGQGFAVIADEVRTLAAQSAQATADIENLVARIQLETNEVLSAMETGTKQVTVGTRLVDETRQSLNQIAVTSSKINQLVDAIASAAQEQSATSEVVSQTMTDVASIAEKNSASATQVSSSFKELLALAGELQQGVGKFKV